MALMPPALLPEPPALLPEPPDMWERLLGAGAPTLTAGLAGLLALAWRALEWADTWQSAVDVARACAV